jgi:hypothetical protein
MKNLLTTASLSSLFVPFAHAQLGVKAGLNVAELAGRDGESASYKTFYHVGIFYQAKLLGPLSVQPEVQYSLAGGNLESAFTDYATRLHYVTVPMLAKLTLGPVFVEAGPQFGFLVSAEQSGRLQVSQAPDGNPAYGDVSAQPAISSFRHAEFSVGLRLVGGLSVGGRLVAGLNDVNDLRNLSGISDPRLQNRAFQAYAAFQLPEK